MFSSFLIVPLSACCSPCLVSGVGSVAQLLAMQPTRLVLHLPPPTLQLKAVGSRPLIFSQWTAVLGERRPGAPALRAGLCGWQKWHASTRLPAPFCFSCCWNTMHDMHNSCLANAGPARLQAPRLLHPPVQTSWSG